jgi:hypothetical protein
VTELNAFREVPQPVVFSSATTPAAGFFVPEPAPFAWEQLLDFNEPQYDASNHPFLAGGAFDAGAAAAELPPPPFNSGEQLAAWLANANADDIARFISGGYAPTPGSFGTGTLDAYGPPTSTPVFVDSSSGGLGLDGNHPLAAWPQEPSGLEWDSLPYVFRCNLTKDLIRFGIWSQRMNEGGSDVSQAVPHPF